MIALYVESRTGLIQGYIDYQGYVITAGVERHLMVKQQIHYHPVMDVRSRTRLTGSLEQKNKELNFSTASKRGKKMQGMKISTTNPPKPYNMKSQNDLRRWFREMKGYLRVSHFLDDGTDMPGRKFAMEGFDTLEKILVKIDCGEDPDCEKCPNICAKEKNCEHCPCPLECTEWVRKDLN